MKRLVFAAHPTGSEHDSWGDILLFAGAGMIIIGLIGLFKRKAFSAQGFDIDRRTNPIGFWFTVVTQVILGIGFACFAMHLKGRAQ